VKIVHIIFSLNTGGAESMLVDIINEQIQNADVGVIILNRENSEYLLGKIDNRVKVYLLNRKEGSKNLFNVFKLNVLLYKLDVDVLHCHNHNIAPLIFPFLRRNTILTLHSIGIPTNYLHKYSKLYSISKSVRNELLIRAKIDSVVIYNGINTNLIKINQKQSIDKIFKIVQIGRLDHKIKGQHLSIEAIFLLSKKGINNIQLDMIGAGESERFLKKIVRKYELETRINFLGLKDRDYIYSHLKHYNLLVQPSLNEGFGLSIAEAMVAKVPVLISDIDGPMEIIKNGKFGYYFNRNNPESLASSIEYIINTYSSIDSINKTNQAYDNVSKNLSVKNTSLKYLKQYDCLKDKA